MRGSASRCNVQRLLRFATACLLLLAPSSCQTGTACSNHCEENQPAVLQLSCVGADLTSVALSGPCSTMFDASPSNYLFAGDKLAIHSPTAGACQVTLVFASGFTYSTSVSFASNAGASSAGCAACPAFVTPTPCRFRKFCGLFSGNPADSGSVLIVAS